MKHGSEDDGIQPLASETATATHVVRARANRCDLCDQLLSLIGQSYGTSAFQIPEAVPEVQLTE